MRASCRLQPWTIMNRERIRGSLHLSPAHEMIRFSRRKLFSAILTLVVLFAFLSYVVSPRAFVRRPEADSSDADEGSSSSSEDVHTGAATAHRPPAAPGPIAVREAVGGSGGGGERKATTKVTKATKAAGNARTSSPYVSRETKGRLRPVTSTIVAGTLIHSEDSSKTLDTKILKIRTPPKCGASGYKVNLDSKTDRMPEWAEGSTPLPNELTLPEPETTAPYFVQVTSELQCYKKGTNLTETLAASNVSQCSCLPGYHGEDCGIPSPVWHSPEFKEWVSPYLSLRPTLRRIIQAIPVNHELDLADVRVHELGDAVTATILAESDFTAAGELKDRFFERRAREDPSFLAPYRNRTILLRANTFPPEGCTNGWASDQFSRSFIGKEGLPRLHGLQDDDLFLLFDADEIPRREVVDFLRFYEGYREPIAFRMRWFIYGFFWESVTEKTGIAAPTRIEAGCSVRMLRKVYDGNPYSIRREAWVNDGKQGAIDKARAYELSMGWRLRTFEIGSDEHPGGYHCSWCFRDFKGLQIKLVSSQLADGPRWGSLPNRLQPDYLRRIVREGEWFDGRKNFAPRNISEEVEKNAVALKNFAPSDMLRHFEKYSSFLVNPSQRENRTLMDQYRKEIGQQLVDPHDWGIR